MPTTKRERMFIFISQIFAGIGIGALMGLIIGLSVSPVVKSILGTLSGLLGVFLGLQDTIFGKGEKTEDSVSPVVLSSLRAGAFGLSCALFLIFGLYLRTNDAIGLSVKDQVARWTDAGYDSTLAHELALYEKINMTSKQLLSLHLSKSASNTREGDTTQVAAGNGVGGGTASTFLFSYKDLPQLANILDPRLYDNNAANTLSEYKATKVPQLLNYANAVEVNFKEENRLDILSEITALTIALSTREKEYNQLSKILMNIQQAKKWAKENSLPELSNVISTIEKNVSPDKQDDFTQVISEVLFDIKFP